MIRKHLAVAFVVAVVAAVAASVALAGPPSKLSGIDVWGYCNSIGYEGATLTKPEVGPRNAFNNWRCFTGSTLHPFSMEQACKFDYGLEAVQAHPENPNDAYTWTCYATSTH